MTGHKLSKLSFADRLCQAIEQKKTPLVVGLDPRWEQLPPELRESSDSNQTNDSDHLANRYVKFCTEIIDVIHPLVPAIKPQSAFFEQLGASGTVALSEVVDYAKARGLMVIMDAKRGDIGSTAEAYAQAYLGDKPLSPWGCDALTVNPYLGGDSIEPFVKVADAHQAGIYVLVKTSNPGSKTLQELSINGGSLYETVADWIQSLAIQSAGACGYGSTGAVIGATYPEQLAQLRQRMPNTLFLIPGFGAQGGSAKDVAGGLDPNGQGAVINSSRGITFAYETKRYQGCRSWQSAVERATEDAIAEIAAETSAGKLR